MKKCILFLLLLYCITLTASGQNAIISGCPDEMPNIPTVYFSCVDDMYPTATEGNYNGMDYMAEKPYVAGHMKMMNNGSVVYDSGEYSETTGCRIKIRGNTSAFGMFPSYKLKLSQKADVLDFGYKEKDWVLLKAKPSWANHLYLLDEIVGFTVARLLGMEWSPNCRIVNLVLNGDFRGLYILTDQVERSRNRCDIEKSGFLIEKDAYWFGESVWFDTVHGHDNQGMDLRYTFKYPDSEDVNDDILCTIRDYMNDFESALYRGEDISKYIDLHSFAIVLLAYDILGSIDSAGSNIFFYKKDFDPENPFSSKLMRGPIWDLDGTFNVAEKWTGLHFSNYAYDMELLKRSDFVSEYISAWNEVKGKLLDETIKAMRNVKLQYGEALDRSCKLDFEYCDYYLQNIDDEMDFKSKWLANRIEWMDSHIEELVKQVSAIEGQSLQNKKSDDSYYDLQGHHATTLRSGNVYIHNGRKIRK